jgi:hypothetical protein
LLAIVDAPRMSSEPCGAFAERGRVTSAQGVGVLGRHGARGPIEDEVHDVTPRLGDWSAIRNALRPLVPAVLRHVEVEGGVGIF